MGCYEKLKKFKKKYKLTVSWRLKKHCKIVDLHINPDEEILYTFAAQKNDNPLDIFTTAVVALTTKRIIIAQKRVVFGYFFNSITPDLYNDMQIYMGLLWGKVTIDTIKETLVFSNIQKDALPEIETEISTYMMREKLKYKERDIAVK